MNNVNPGARTNIEDILFANRNKAYGAYEIRKKYSAFVSRSLLIGVAIFALALLIPAIVRALNPPEEEEKEQIVSAELMEPPPLDPNEPPPPPPPPVEIPKVDQVRFLPPEVVEDEKVPQEEKIATVEELDTANAAAVTQQGDPNAEEDIVVEESGNGNAVIDEAPKEEIFTAVEIMPSFNGDLKKFLERNLRYPNAAQRAGVEGKVYVQFIVGQNGDIRDVQVVKGLGFGLDEEAIRVVKMMPNWNPGRQGGRTVTVKYTQPIVFKLNQ